MPLLSPTANTPLSSPLPSYFFFSSSLMSNASAKLRATRLHLSSLDPSLLLREVLSLLSLRSLSRLLSLASRAPRLSSLFFSFSPRISLTRRSSVSMRTSVSPLSPGGQGAGVSFLPRLPSVFATLLFCSLAPRSGETLFCPLRLPSSLHPASFARA